MLASLGVWLMVSASAVGQETTQPVGFLRIPIAGGTTNQPSVTALANPLMPLASPVTGLRRATIDAVDGNTLTSRNAGWTPGSLTMAASPWRVRILTGVSAGRILDILANTASTVTIRVDGVPALGLIAGQDQLELVPVATLSALGLSFSALGGSSAGVADVVSVLQAGVWVRYYYHSAQLGWRRADSASSLRYDHLPIVPETGVMIARRGGAATLTVFGRVSTVSHRFRVTANSTTATHVGFPIDLTLGQLALQTRVTGWRSGSADRVFVRRNGVWTPYLFSGSFWTNPGGAPEDGLVLPAGSLIQIHREAGPSSVDFVLPSPAGL